MLRYCARDCYSLAFLAVYYYAVCLCARERLVSATRSVPCGVAAERSNSSNGHCSPVAVALRSRLHSSKTRTALDVAFFVLLGTTPLQMVPIFPGEVNLRFAGDFFFVGADASITSGLQQRHTEQNGSPGQDALEHISRPRS